MADIRVDQLTTFPIKSLGGVLIPAMNVTDLGPESDRRWMLVDERGVAITQREKPVMSQCEVEIEDGRIVVSCDGQSTELPLEMSDGDRVSVEIWGDRTEAVRGPAEAAVWFSELLESPCSPVYMLRDAVRNVNPFFAPSGSKTTFTDGFPILVTSTASLADLNQRLESAVPMSRFRPNVVVKGGEPFAEDGWGRVRVGTATIRGVKPCSRCAITTINSRDRSKGKEPLRTLATYRKWGTHVYFGENFLVERGGEIRVGDRFTIENERTSAEIARSRI